MKLRTSLLVLSAALLLAGCSAAPAAWETVDDEIVEASGPLEEPYIITFGVPTDVDDPPVTDGSRCLYVQKDGDYEILSDVFTARNCGEAIRQLSGFEAAELDVLETERFGLPEYRFAWASESDEGTFVSQAALVEDGSYYYALVFSVREGLGGQYADCAEAVFSSFGVYGNEML